MRLTTIIVVNLIHVGAPRRKWRATAPESPWRTRSLAARLRGYTTEPGSEGMSEEAKVKSLSDALIGDVKLRLRFQHDPVAVFQDHGIELSEAQKAKLLAEEWHKKTEDEVTAKLSEPRLAAWL
jgi:hypothetical protein